MTVGATKDEYFLSTVAKHVCLFQCSRVSQCNWIRPQDSSIFPFLSLVPYFSKMDTLWHLNFRLSETVVFRAFWKRKLQMSSNMLLHSIIPKEACLTSMIMLDFFPQTDKFSKKEKKKKDFKSYSSGRWRIIFTIK